MIGLTKTGLGFVSLSLLIYIVSLQEYTGLLFLVLGILIGCCVYNTFAVLRNVRALNVIAPPTITGEEGKHLQGSWIVSNQSKKMAGFVELLSPFGVVFRVGRIKNGQSIRISTAFSINKRGIYPYRDFFLRSAFPFGLIQYKHRLPEGGEIIVYPFIYQCDPPKSDGFVPMLGGKFVGKYRSVMGDHFHGVRPMQNNDPVRFVHWPSSSKGQGMMVKEFNEELSGSVTLLIDCRPGFTPEGDSALDWALRAAGSLSLAVLDQGNQLTIVNLGHDSVMNFSPFTNSDIILTELARINEVENIPITSQIERVMPDLPGRGSLCFVILKADPEIALFLKVNDFFLSRKVSIYMPDYEENLSLFEDWDIYIYSAYNIKRPSE